MCFLFPSHARVVVALPPSPLKPQPRLVVVGVSRGVGHPFSKDPPSSSVNIPPVLVVVPRAGPGPIKKKRFQVRPRIFCICIYLTANKGHAFTVSLEMTLSMPEELQRCIPRRNTWFMAEALPDFPIRGT